ncbi:MAG: HNH endonuclease [Elusimicrobia bacterium]|nr:HNH endonuclease [Elusimicrobiota bacterium]
MNLAQLSDETLLGKVEALAETERFSLADFLVHLGELDQRAACQNKGYASAFAFLTRHLGYSECDAMRRVRAARAARKYPSILRMLAAGELHLVGVAMLQPVLTSENHERLLRKASRRSTREVERMVAELTISAREPRDRIRALSSTQPSDFGSPPAGAPVLGGSQSTPEEFVFSASSSPELVLPPTESGMGGESVVRAESAERVASTELAGSGSGRVVFTFAAGEETRSWFEQARDLLRHRFPAGRMEEVIGEALRRLVEEERLAKINRRRKNETSCAAPGGDTRRNIVRLVPAGRKYTLPAGMRQAAREGSNTLRVAPGGNMDRDRPAGSLGERTLPARGSMRRMPDKNRAAMSFPGGRQGRHIPSWVRKKVWQRDAGRCAYIGPERIRCGETAWLEWDHIIPWVLGGSSNDPANIRLLCRAHNQSEARRLGLVRTQGA